MGGGRGMEEEAGEGVGAHDHDTEAPEVPVPVATGVYDSFLHGVSYGSQYRGNCCDRVWQAQMSLI